MDTQLQSFSQLIPNMLEAWNAHIIPEDAITIIDADTAALHRPTQITTDPAISSPTLAESSIKSGVDVEPILCHLKPLQDANRHEAILRAIMGDHPGIERYYGVTQSWMVMENAPSKTFREAVEVIKIDRAAIWEILIQVAAGMQHLHRHDIAHRRLSLDSITFRCLEDGNGEDQGSGNLGYEAIISDFSRAIMIADTEIFPKDPTLKAKDMKDFGFLIWQAFHEGQWPISTSTLEGCSPDLPPAIRTLMTDCWQETPTFDDAFIARLRAISFTPTTSSWSYCSIC